MHWSATQFSFIAVAFQVGMLAGQVPAGMFLDSAGTRIGLATIFVLWSALGAGHALAASLVAFIVRPVLHGRGAVRQLRGGHQGHRRAVSRREKVLRGRRFQRGCADGDGDCGAAGAGRPSARAAGLQMAFVVPARSA
jgi:hypothetical protein